MKRKRGTSHTPTGKKESVPLHLFTGGLLEMEELDGELYNNLIFDPQQQHTTQNNQLKQVEQKDKKKKNKEKKKKENTQTPPRKKQKKDSTQPTPSHQLQEQPSEESSAWEEFGLHPVLLKGLQFAGFKEPTLIQRRTLMAAIRDAKDVIGAAETV